MPADCVDVFNRIPQHTLDRRAAGTGAIVTASTQTNCIRQCLSASVGDARREKSERSNVADIFLQQKLGFECASASYFFDWPAENCYLSRFSRVARPDLYVAERKDLVDYIEMASCMLNSKFWRLA